ncbi:hypothetical protein DL96DRAFT_1631338 [Flagelloscypha sp. PMI_526]|nr:hypothetical protein DL96DRAFT_1631338 [Flagelloscypha sp. PMI_526]
MPNTVILDDRSAQIVYSSSPGWEEKGTFPDWRSTSKRPLSAGASFELTFQGTSIEVLGVLQPLRDKAVPVVSSFYLDGGIVKNFTAPSNVPHNTFFNSFFSASNLDPNENHTLLWSQTNNGVIFLDAIIYEASPIFSPKEDTNYVIDQSDSRVQYDGSWSDLGSDQVFKGQLKYGKRSGDSISLKFNGSAIAMYGKLDLQGNRNTEGKIPTASTLVTYTVDSGAPMKASYPIPSDADKSFGEQLCLLNSLPSDKEHTFTMRLENNQSIYIDYFIVSPVGKEVASKSHLFQMAQQNAISNNSPLGGGGSRPNVGAIAGGVIGCVGFIALSILLFLLFRKRRRANTLPFDDIPRSTVQIAPFVNTSLNRSTVKEVYSPDSSQGNRGGVMTVPAFPITRGLSFEGQEPPSYDASMGRVAGQPSMSSRVLQPNR